MIRPGRSGDVAQVCDIYNYYIRETIVTFEESPMLVPDMAKRIAEITEHLPWLVWEEAGVIVGYSYATPWKARAAYRHSVEGSVYLSPPVTGRGIGSQLYKALIEDLRHRGMHCLIGGVALPNPASVALHEKLGFEKVAQFRQVGFKFEKWIDVAYWELVL